MTVEKSSTDLSTAPVEENTPSGNSNFFYQKITFGIIAAVFISLTAWSWRKWPDILVDFGQQLYIPWQLASGRHLYTDIIFLHGPLSQHFNAVWFYLFGPSLTVLIYVNLAILACTTVIIYKTVRLFADRLIAAICAIIFLSVFGFAQYVGIGNYNWITPYTHEATHGVALIAAFILLWSRLMINYKRSTCMLSALCLGLALLTKVDIAMAAIAVALMAGVTYMSLIRSEYKKVIIADVLLFVGMVVAPATGFFIYFLTYMPAGKALAAITSGLTIIPKELALNPFYLRVMGLDNAGGNLTLMTGMTALLFGLIFTAVAMDILCRRWLLHPLRLGLPLAFAIFILLLLWPALIPWTKITRALPPFIVAAFIAFVVLFFKSPHRNKLRPTLLPMILWAVFALALISKIILNVRFANYGFYLAVPATLVTVVCLLYWIPKWLNINCQSGMVFQWLVLAVLAAGVVYYLKLSDHFYRPKEFSIGNGGDMFLTYQPDIFEPAGVIDSALKWIKEKIPPEATVVALPEGAMINYLSRRSASTPITNFMMTELIFFGEDKIVDYFKAHPPDYVVLVHKNSSEFGVGPFGIDPKNGLKIMQWVNQNYSPAVLIGGEPFQSGKDGTKIFIGRRPFQPSTFGIKILKRNSISQNS